MIPLILDTISTRRAALAASRIAICKTCDHYRPKTSRCNICGCYMNFKARLDSSECPIGLWAKVEENVEPSAQPTTEI